MNPQLFEKCVRFLSRNYQLTGIEELTAGAFDKKGKQIAAITFDDGYKDNIEYAAPILSKYKAPASFYVVTDCINQNITPWTHIIGQLFQQTKKTEADFDTEILPDHLKITKWKNAEDKHMYAKQLIAFLKTTSNDNRKYISKQLESSLTDVELPKMMMSWKDLEELKTAGFAIGSHTASHSILGIISDKDILREEILNSGKEIEKHLGDFPLSISYPFGSHNKTTLEVVKEAGYKTGLIVQQRIYGPQDNLLEIPRIELYNEHWIKVRMRMNLGIEKMKNILRYGK